MTYAVSGRSIVEGMVTSIASFGAFVQLPEERPDLFIYRK